MGTLNTILIVAGLAGGALMVGTTFFGTKGDFFAKLQAALAEAHKLQNSGIPDLSKVIDKIPNLHISDRVAALQAIYGIIQGLQTKSLSGGVAIPPPATPGNPV